MIRARPGILPRALVWLCLLSLAGCAVCTVVVKYHDRQPVESRQPAELDAGKPSTSTHGAPPK